MRRHHEEETPREEAARLDRLEEEGAHDELPYTRLRRYAKEPSQVYAIRIPVSRLETIRKLADARGEQPTALLREWVLERLDEELADLPRPKGAGAGARRDTKRAAATRQKRAAQVGKKGVESKTSTTRSGKASGRSARKTG